MLRERLLMPLRMIFRRRGRFAGTASCLRRGELARQIGSRPGPPKPHGLRAGDCFAIRHAIMMNIEQLTFRLGSRLLFDMAGAALPPRGRIGFVGRNGTGKTTLVRLVCGELSPETGEINLPRLARIGRVEQEAPGGPQSLIDFVLEADTERAELLAAAEKHDAGTDIAAIHTRLADIDAHSAPARAATILAGLGFDEAAQQRPLSSFSGGWRMRVALAAVLFVKPDMLLLDEPTNYLDLEGTLWLTEHLRSYPATVLLISHDRELLDDVTTHILHLENAKLKLWTGNYTSFAHQRAEARRLNAKAVKKQDAHRAHLQAFVDRFRASATKARQAQSRLKMLAKMQDIAADDETDVIAFHFPSPEKPLAPPMLVMEDVSVGYDGKAVLKGLNLSLQPDDRIGLLGANGNGKSTFARLLAGRMEPMGGNLRRAARLSAGFFAQHQMDDLDASDTPHQVMARLMPGAGEAKTRGAAARLGFANVRANTRIELLSGGEKARLLLGLATFHGPHLLILDEPTNHLDIDSRAALAEAINEFQGAVILISHDSFLLEACAERLWLVEDGSVSAFEGDIGDYRRRVLGTPPPKAVASDRRQSEAANGKVAALPAAKTRGLNELRRASDAVLARIEKFTALLAKVDAVLAEPQTYTPRERTQARSAV